MAAHATTPSITVTSQNELTRGNGAVTINGNHAGNGQDLQQRLQPTNKTTWNMGGAKMAPNHHSNDIAMKTQNHSSEESEHEDETRPSVPMLLTVNHHLGHGHGPMRQISAVSSEGGPLVTIGGEGSSSGSGEGEGAARAGFANHSEFLAGMISMAVGLGNVWRFPYLCQKNGGGAFLIPYVILLLLEGMPLSLIEIGLGQIKHKGSIGVWREIHPRLGGLGISSTVVSFLVGMYYNVVITWCLYYLFRSFTTTLPWSECPLTANGTVVPECAGSSETQYFWYREALDSTGGIGDFGGFKLWMLACLILAWGIVFLTMRKGIQSSGKVLYITAFFPYVVLTIFFFRAVTLRGAGTGLLHLLTPRLDQLLDPIVWMDAATQVFYSMSIAFGGIIAYSSYLPRNNDCTKDAVMTSLINLVTSIFTVTVVFSILGFKATVTRDNCLVKFNDTIGGSLPTLDVLTVHMENVPHGYDAATIQEAFKACNLTEELNKAAGGTGLAFIVFTQAIVEFPGAPFWSVLFFLMLLALGFGSEFGTMQGVVTNIFDVFHGKITNSKGVLMGALCIICFLFDLIFVTGAGEYWVFLFDNYASNGLILIGFVQVVVLTYYYGWRRFVDEIDRYTGRRPGLYWTICWRFVSPTIIAVIFVASMVRQALDSAEYNVWDRDEAMSKNVSLPRWALTIGICLMLLSFIPLPVVFLIEYLRKSPSVRASSNSRSMGGRPTVHRVGTTTSTQPMMNGMDGDEEDNALNDDDDDDDDRTNGPTVLCVLHDSDEAGLDEEIPRYKGIF